MNAQLRRNAGLSHFGYVVLTVPSESSEGMLPGRGPTANSSTRDQPGDKCNPRIAAS